MLGLILIVLLVLFLAGGIGAPYWGGAYGYGFGHGSIGIGGIILLIVVVLLLTGRLG